MSRTDLIGREVYINSDQHHYGQIFQTQLSQCVSISYDSTLFKFISTKNNHMNLVANNKREREDVFLTDKNVINCIYKRINETKRYPYYGVIVKKDGKIEIEGAILTEGKYNGNKLLKTSKYKYPYKKEVLNVCQDHDAYFFKDISDAVKKVVNLMESYLVNN